VVDHGSTDNTTGLIREQFPDVHVINGDSSMWWTAATNLGIRHVLSFCAKDDYVLTLNNDLEADPQYLEQLQRASSQNVPCITGSASLYYSDRQRISFIGTYWNKLTARYRRHELSDLAYSAVKEKITYAETDLLPGRGMLIPVSAFNKVGLFNEKVFPHYAADEDFSRRCLQKGYKLIVAVHAVVYSHVSATESARHKQDPLLKRMRFTFGSIKSPSRLSTRWQFAKRNSPLPPLYFLFDFARIAGFLIRSTLKKEK
jgi:GT2 family glycosyltransferase